MTRLFAHRGFVTKNINQNSIESLNAAYANNFCAIEFDIWFLEEKLFLKHDAPKKSELKNLLQLKDYFCFGNQFDYWLDFKNLDEKNVDRALVAVKKEISTIGLDLKRIYFAPFITDYKKSAKILAKIRKYFGSKANIVGVCEKLKDFDDIKTLREFLTKNKIKHLSIYHGLLDKTMSKIFSDIEFFAWTVNDIITLKTLQDLGVKNFATDTITPRIYDKKFATKAASRWTQISHQKKIS